MAAAEPPAPAPAVLYVDTSAMLKLLVRAAIERELLQWSELATSVITEVELPRAVARAREERTDAVIDGSVVLQGVLASAAIIPLSENIVAAARSVKPVHVGALDAIHIASAISLGKQLAGVATYDKRMQDALGPLGVEVIAPEEAGPAQRAPQPSRNPGSICLLSPAWESSGTGTQMSAACEGSAPRMYARGACLAQVAESAWMAHASGCQGAAWAALRSMTQTRSNRPPDFRSNRRSLPKLRSSSRGSESDLLDQIVGIDLLRSLHHAGTASQQAN